MHLFDFEMSVKSSNYDNFIVAFWKVFYDSWSECAVAHLFVFFVPKLLIHSLFLLALELVHFVLNIRFLILILSFPLFDFLVDLRFESKLLFLLL